MPRRQETKNPERWDALGVVACEGWVLSSPTSHKTYSKQLRNASERRKYEQLIEARPKTGPLMPLICKSVSSRHASGG